MHIVLSIQYHMIWHSYSWDGTVSQLITSQHFRWCHMHHIYNVKNEFALSDDDVIKWKQFRVTGPLCGNSPVNSPHKGQWRGALMFSLIFTWTNGGVNNRNACDLRRHRTHYDVTVMSDEKWWHPMQTDTVGVITQAGALSHLPLD